MGILPYHTREEYQRIDTDIKHQKNFLANLGYRPCYDVNERRHCIWFAELKASNGKTYTSKEEFAKDMGGWGPNLIDKDGICWNEYVALRKEGYIRPYDDECQFLYSKGYERNGPLSKDYMKDIELCRYHHEKYGYVPRWVNKYGDTFGHEQILEKEGYQYPFWKNEWGILDLIPRFVHPCS